MKRYFSTAKGICLLVLSMFSTQVLALNYEVLLFPEFNASIEDYDHPHTDINPGIDGFAAIRMEDFSLIAEYFLNKNESELERLLIGWDASDNLSIWLGRHHNYTGYWNTEFHHGAFFETSISRPSITQFEDDDGIIPTHITGLAGEFNLPLGDATIRFAMAVGIGATYGSDSKLAAFDILDPRLKDHDGTFSLKISYFPETFDSNQFGITIGGGSIPSQKPEFDHIDQFFAGSFVNWQFEKVKFISELTFIYNRIYQPSTSFRAHILGGYLQAEVPIADRWTLYGRYEGTVGQKQNLSNIFPDYVEETQVVGLRFDLDDNNALKLEFGRLVDFEDASPKASFQWSAIFP